MIYSIPDAVSDTLAVTGRNLIALRRVPQLLVFATIQPVIFMLLFRYVFGGAIRVPGGHYVDYLIPGIFGQTIAFGAMNTAVGIAADMKMGFLERFRALPMARSAVLTARTLADLARNVLVVALMTAVGFAVGFHAHGGPLGLLAALALVLLFGYALSWIFVIIGLAVGDPEAVPAACVPVILLLVFASSAFVPIHSMPSWLQVFANHQPVSVLISAVRALALGNPASSLALQTLAWSLGILLIFAPLASWRYQRVT
jgi:ABC transporter DrrB family efflux protein